MPDRCPIDAQSMSVHLAAHKKYIIGDFVVGFYQSQSG